MHNAQFTIHNYKEVIKRVDSSLVKLILSVSERQVLMLCVILSVACGSPLLIFYLFNYSQFTDHYSLLPAFSILVFLANGTYSFYILLHLVDQKDLLLINILRLHKPFQKSILTSLNKTHLTLEH